jgi:hypothetical protein
MIASNLNHTVLDSEDKLYKDEKLRYAQTPAWEVQSLAPAPSQTLFHLGVYLRNKEPANASEEKCIIVLRDWPRKRGSQHWTRTSQMNPGEKVITLSAFVNAEFKQELETIFGADTYKQLESFILGEFPKE